MNIQYKNIYNRALGVWMAVAENVSVGGKSTRGGSTSIHAGRDVHQFFKLSLLAGVVSVSCAAQAAAPRVEQVVCNPTDGGAVVRTWDTGLPIVNGSALSANTYFGSSSTTTAGVTTCVIPVANIGIIPFGSMNEVIGMTAAQPGTTEVFIDYTNTTGVYTGTTNNDRRFLILSNGFMEDGVTPQNRTGSLSAPGTALLANNAIVHLRGNGEVRGDIKFSGADNEININDGAAYSAYHIDMNGNVDASAASNGIKLNVKYATFNGNFTGSAFDDTATYGAGTQTFGNIDAGNGNNSFTMKEDAKMTGAISSGTGNDLLTLSDTASLTGSISSGAGSDTVTINGPGVSLSGITFIDGGDDVSATDGMIDTLKLNAVTATYAGENIRNMEAINLVGSNLTLSGSSLATGRGVSGVTQLGVNIDTSSTLGFQSTAFAINGDVSNAGSLSLRGAAPGQVVTVNGDYKGNGGKLLFNTVLGNDSSVTDKLVVTGNTSGTGSVYVNNVGGAGAQTVNGIKLIEVAGTSGAAFTLGAPVQVGAWDYLLNQKGNDFYLESNYSTTPTPTPTPSPTPSLTSTPTPSPTPTPTPTVYRPAVGAYVTAQNDNFELGLGTLGTLHQRVSDDRLRKYEQCGDCNENSSKQAWGRIGGSNIDSVGATQFDLKQKYAFAQIGTDLLVQTDKDGKSHTTAGVMGSYGNSDSSSYNVQRLTGGLNTFTGNLKTTALSIGGYFTRYAEDASYFDVVGQVSSIENKFNDIYSVAATQKGMGLGLSAEVGKPFTLGDGMGKWSIEPQAQLSYQHFSYKAFSDSVSNISAFTADNLRARIGARLSWGDLAKTSKDTSSSNFYMTANVLADLIKPASVTIGGTSVSEDINAKPWLELGVGGQLALSETAQLYGNVNYQRSLSSTKTREGASGNIGVRVRW